MREKRALEETLVQCRGGGGGVLHRNTVDDIWDAMERICRAFDVVYGCCSVTTYILGVFHIKLVRSCPQFLQCQRSYST